MIKIINPCYCEVYKERKTRAFAKIRFTDGKLSICGVVGPKNNGDCMGSAGQCTDSIRECSPAEDWTEEMLQKFCDIWDRWHLNDMRPYCEHQKALGWDKLAHKEVTLYHYRLTSEALGKQREVEKAALNALRKGETFTPSSDQVMFATLPYSVVSHEEMDNTYYEPKKPLFPGDKGATETKTLGWLNAKEHPDGLLCKPCPVCGYKYGTSWLKEEVPQDVIDWLSSLPDTKVEPAWV